MSTSRREVGEVGRQVGLDGRAQRLERVRADEAGRSGGHPARSLSAAGGGGSRSVAGALAYPAGTVRLVEIRLLEGPNVYRLEPVVKLEVAVGRRRTWYGQRDPGRHALVWLGATVPAREWPDPVAAVVGLDPAAAPEPRRGSQRARRPPLVGPRALDRHVPVDRRGTGAHAHRGGPRPRRARRLAVADRPADRRPGSGSWRAGRERLAAARRHRRPGSATPTGGCRSSRSSGTNGKTTVTRLITHILVLAGHHVGTTTSDGVLVDERMVDAGDWTGPGGAQHVLARGDIDVAVLETARGGIVLRGMGYESNDAAVLTNVSSDHLDLQGIHTLPELAEVKATVARITKPDGWVVLNADDPLVAAVARRVRGQRRPVLDRRRTPAGRRSGAIARRAAGTSSSRRLAGRARGPRRADRDRRGRARCRSRSAGWPATTSPTRSPPPAARAAWARRSTQVRDGPASTSGRRPTGRPGGSTCSGSGARS